MSVFIIDPLRTECLVLHNQHFPIAVFFPPKLPLCKIRILYSFDKRINLPRAKLPDGEGLPKSSHLQVSFDTWPRPGGFATSEPTVGMEMDLMMAEVETTWQDQARSPVLLVFLSTLARTPRIGCSDLIQCLPAWVQGPDLGKPGEIGCFYSTSL